MLLLDGKEVLVGILMSEDHSLATERTNLRAANVEHVAVTGEVGEGDVASLCHQAIAQACAIDIERYLVTLASLVDVIELLGGVKRAKLGGEGDIHKSWMHGIDTCRAPWPPSFPLCQEG